MEEENRMNTKGFDVLDLDILERLKQDSRYSYRKIGEEIQIPHTTVYSRALRMEERGLVHFKVNLVPEKLGLREAVILIKCPINRFDFFAEDLKDDGLIDLKQTDKGLLATFIFPETSYLKELEEMLIYVDKTFGYSVEAFAVSQSMAINNFAHIKKLLKNDNKEGNIAKGKKGKTQGSKQDSERSAL
jgi:DNA-binding Lrp family transcriptional regulator